MDTRRVCELMLPLDRYATTRHDCTLRDALVALSNAQLGLTYDRHHHRAVLVLGDEGTVIGKVTHWSILKALMPGALSEHDHEALARAGLSPGFIETLQQRHPFHGSIEQMCALADRLCVREAMVPAEECIDENARMCQAIALMVKEHAQSVLVKRDGVVVGILRMSDVFEEVADAVRTGGGNRVSA